MSSNTKNFYTSDLHFQHHNLYTRGVRSFSCAEDCEEFIMKNFNQVIRPHDNLYILGDLSLSANYDQLASYLNSINGNKIVIMGNHDKTSTLDRLKADKVIANWHPWKGCRDHELPIFMTHFVPLEAHTGPEPRIYLHGHVHGSLKSMHCLLRYDVGVDACDYRPFSLDTHVNLTAVRMLLDDGGFVCPVNYGSMCDICRISLQRGAEYRATKGVEQCLEQ